MKVREWFRVMRAEDWKNDPAMLISIQRALSWPCDATKWLNRTAGFYMIRFASQEEADAYVARQELLNRLARQMKESVYGK
jgi:hypothetical protein